MANGAIINSSRLNHMEDGIGNAFDKTSDTVGVRNYVLNTGVPYVATGDGTSSNQFLIYSIAQDIPMTNDLWVSFDLSVANPDGGTFQMQFDGNNNKNRGYICGYGNGVNLTSGHYSYHYGYRNNANPINNGIYFYILNSKATVTISNLCVYLGDTLANWLPAPEDVNQQLDKKVTDDKDGSITVNGESYNIGNSGLTPLPFVTSGSFNDLPLGVVFADATKVTDGPDSNHSFTTITFYAQQWGNRKAQIAIADSTNIMFFRVMIQSGWRNWTMLADDSKVVHTADMRKSPSDVAGIEEVNAKQDVIGYTPADDSKVAHLSGANNFDTVPTYGNNEIPLALNNSGSTANRPTGQVVGYQYFDTTLNKPIWYNGTHWVDSTGTTV